MHRDGWRGDPTDSTDDRVRSTLAAAEGTRIPRSHPSLAQRQTVSGRSGADSLRRPDRATAAILPPTKSRPTRGAISTVAIAPPLKSLRSTKIPISKSAANPMRIVPR